MQNYHAFLCYNSKNIAEVETIREYLSNAHFKTFFDKLDIKPGQRHSERIDKALRESNAVLVFIGPDGLGPWQEEELFAAIWESVVKKKVVIPVVLPGAALHHDCVPGSIRNRSAVTFQKSVSEVDELQRLYDALLEEPPIAGDEFEKPVTVEEAERLLHSTICAYNNTDRAQQFYEVWKDDIPMDKLEPMLKQLPRMSKILDAGCGPGHHSHFLSKQGYEVHAIDLSTASIELAGKTGVGPTFLEMDMRDTSFARNTFDAVWASATCVHTPDAFLDRQINEFLRVLRPGGLLGMTLQVERLAAVEPDGRFFEGYRSWDDIYNRLNVAGFDITWHDSDLTDKTTDGIKKVAKWVGIVAKAPEKGRIVVG